MKKFAINIVTPINGIYLSNEMIDLLKIIQCENIEELKIFIQNCSQLELKENLNFEEDLEIVKRKLFKQYTDTFVSQEESIKNSEALMKRTLEHCGIPKDKIAPYILLFKEEGIEKIKERLLEDFPMEYDKFAQKQHRFISNEKDQIKSVSYDEIKVINEQLKNHNTILIGSGKYNNVVNKLYIKKGGALQQFDFYFPKRDLDFAYKNGKNVRYHTLLDKNTCQMFKGKSKEEVLKELEIYVKKTIDFITEYNQKHKVNGKGIITSIDLFNEIISFEPPYKNIWEEEHNISIEELMNIYKYAEEHKPEGVTYVYNEPFLENSKRRKAVIGLLKQMNKINPGLIDNIGTQMHIELKQNPKDIKKCFVELKKLEKIGIKTQITEFDMCLPRELLIDDDGNVKENISDAKGNEYTSEQIYEYKHNKMVEIENIIKKSKINLAGITYWSISDILDHNLERLNNNLIRQGIPKEKLLKTRFSGLYADFAKEKEEKLNAFRHSLSSRIMFRHEKKDKECEIQSNKSEKNLDER